MDWMISRDGIPEEAFVGLAQPAEAVAAGINAAQPYSSGLLVAVYPRGEGRMALNTLRIRENWDRWSGVGRLLVNMLRYASAGLDHPQPPYPKTSPNDSKPWAIRPRHWE